MECVSAQKKTFWMNMFDIYIYPKLTLQIKTVFLCNDYRSYHKNGASSCAFDFLPMMMTSLWHERAHVAKAAAARDITAPDIARGRVHVRRFAGQGHDTWTVCHEYWGTFNCYISWTIWHTSIDKICVDIIFLFTFIDLEHNIKKYLYVVMCHVL